ncbi:paraflagellar rod component [Trypanosoma brucei equiperdum]|uniref:Paraflagellar rod component n=1 Tax=Trypanosoma brucei equiperdum TaxID=630700 RepID=A0A3L6L9H0_9TRYP|nr:paraflagellar rod component [Trypanosoma brucei equiperdum]
MDAEENFLNAIQQAFDENATALHFSYQEGTTAVPPEIRALRGTLEILHIDNNYSLGSLPSAIGELGRLRWLNASYCRLTTVPREMGRLSHLERLHLGNNLLQELPMEMWQLKSLQELRVENNQLRVLPGGLLFLPRLEVLLLENNPLLLPEEVNGAAPITIAPRLYSVDCSNCCVRMRDHEVLVTVNNKSGHRDIPFVHCVCSDACKQHLQTRLQGYDAANSA